MILDEYIELFTSNPCLPRLDVYKRQFISFFPVILHDNITSKDKTLTIVFIIIFYLFIVKLLIANLLR